MAIKWRFLTAWCRYQSMLKVLPYPCLSLSLSPGLTCFTLSSLHSLLKQFYSAFPSLFLAQTPPTVPHWPQAMCHRSQENKALPVSQSFFLHWSPLTPLASACAHSVPEELTNTILNRTAPFHTWFFSQEPQHSPCSSPLPSDISGKLSVCLQDWEKVLFVLATQ